VDSKAVDAALRRDFWPRLAELGFVDRTGRTARRTRDQSVDVVTVRSFNAYHAEVLATSSFSFSVDLGVHYPALHRHPSWIYPVASSLTAVRCAARLTLPKGIVQPQPQRRRLFHAVDAAADDYEIRDMDRPDVWWVAADGNNVEQVVADARDQFGRLGLPWCAALADLHEAVRRFGDEPNTWLAPGILGEDYGGRVGSRHRLAAVAALAAELGDDATSRRAMEAMTGGEHRP
jgi:hypothetical protein